MQHDQNPSLTDMRFLTVRLVDPPKIDTVTSKLIKESFGCIEFAIIIVESKTSIQLRAIWEKSMSLN
jgi:hypothetical protein